MRILMMLLLVVCFTGCASNKFRMKNCSPIGEVAGEKLYDCEAYHEPKNVREAK